MKYVRDDDARWCQMVPDGARWCQTVLHTSTQKHNSAKSTRERGKGPPHDFAHHTRLTTRESTMFTERPLYCASRHHLQVSRSCHHCWKSEIWHHSVWIVRGSCVCNVHKTFEHFDSKSAWSNPKTQKLTCKACSPKGVRKSARNRNLD